MRKVLRLFIGVVILLALCVSLPSASLDAQESSGGSFPIAESVLPTIAFEETGDYVKLDLVEFYKGSDGYNKAYDEFGEVLVYDSRITLQYLGPGDEWMQRGVPVDVSWEKVSDYEYTVTRSYDDYLGTTYDVIYSVKSGQPTKMTVDLTSGQTDEYRLLWTWSGVTREVYSPRDYGLVFEGALDIEWEDVYLSFGDITTSSVEAHAQGKKVDITFDIGIVEESENFILDPSYQIVAGDPGIRQYAHIRSLARESNGKLWAAYIKSDGTYDQVYVAYSEDDGENWTEIQVTDAGASQWCVSIAIDSSDTLHVVFCGLDWSTETSNKNLQYTKKTSAGVWTPDGPPYTRGNTEPTHVTDVAQDQLEINVAVDGDDTLHIVWCGTGWGTNSTVNNTEYCKVTSELAWAPDGPPYTSGGTQPEHVTDNASAQYKPSIAVDSSGYIHVIWYGKGWGTETTTYNIQYRLRTDSWQTQEGSTDDADDQQYPSIALDSDDIPHITWHGKGYGVNTTINQIVYSNRIGGSWAIPANLTDKTVFQWGPSIGLDGSDNRYIAWRGLGHGENPGSYNIQLLRYESAAWQAREGITDLAFANKEPSILWAFHPIIGDVQTNVAADGCCFRWNYEDVGGKAQRYYCSDDLAWAVFEVPDTPSITSPTDGAENQSRTLSFTSSAYSGSATHLHSDWELSDDGTFSDTDICAYSYDDSTNKTTMAVTDMTFQNSLEGDSELDPWTQYWIRVRHANVVGDSSWSVSTHDFTTTGPLGPPTDFAISEAGVDSVDITWTKGNGAEKTLIRAKREEYPTDVTDGEQVYYDTGTSTADDGLALENTTYYYRAWSWNTIEEYSTEYAEETVGGETMVFLATFVGFILLCLGLTAGGFVFKNTLLFTTAGLSWVGFGVYGFAEASGTGDVLRIVGFLGLAMALICFFKLWDTWRGSRPTRFDEQTSYRKELSTTLKSAQRNKRHREVRELRKRHNLRRGL